MHYILIEYVVGSTLVCDFKQLQLPSGQKCLSGSTTKWNLAAQASVFLLKIR